MKRLLAFAWLVVFLVAPAWGSSISGTVTALEGTTPLEGIHITAYQNAGFWWDAMAWATTDSDGRYTLDGLEGGTYRVGFWDLNGTYAETYFADAADVDGATDIALGASQALTNIHARLAPVSSIAGTVTALDGITPLEDIYVTAYRNKGSWWDSVESTSTDSNGHYTIGGLASGTYRVGFKDWEHTYLEEYHLDAPDVVRATDIALGAGQDREGIDARLTPASGIAGTITGPDGSPLEGIQVTTYCLYEPGYYYINAGGQWTATEADGTYLLKGLTGGTYRVNFNGQSQGFVDQFYGGAYDVDAAADVTVLAETTVDGIDATLAAGGRISGLVSGPSGSPPLDEVTVRTFRRKGTNWIESGSWIWTGFEGQFDFKGLLPGTYRLWFEGRIDDELLLGEYSGDTKDFDQAQELVLAPGATIGNVDVELALASHITGAITDSGGSPVENVHIVAHQFLNGSWDNWAYTNADATGAFDLAGLSPGTYRVKFLPWSSNLAIQWFSNSVTLAGARDIVLGPASTASNVNARLGTASHITGIVTEPSGTPIATVEVQALRLDAGEWRFVESGDTDVSGAYDIGSLPAGTYRLLFWPYAGNYAPQYFANALDIASAIDLVVPAAATVRNINLWLISGCRISGTVTKSDGTTAFPNIEVLGYYFSGGQWTEISDTTTDANGFYELERLPVGQMRLRFVDGNDVYLSEWYNNAATESSAQIVILSTIGQVLTGYNASLAREPEPPAPQSPEFLDIQSAGLSSWTMKFLGERDVDYRLQRLRPGSNDWVDTGSIAIGTGPTNDFPHADEETLGLFRMRVVR